jgi:hypothetical protein
VLTPGRDDASGGRADTRKMTAVSPQTRGLTLILEHCARLNSEDEARPAAVARLRLAIGDELARLLLSSLASDRRRSLLRAV